MVFCVEPMITAGNPEIVLASDKQAYKIKERQSRRPLGAHSGDRGGRLPGAYRPSRNGR